MESITIKVELEDLLKPREQRKGIANIWVSCANQSFPEQHWRDFLFTILPEWSGELLDWVDKPEHIMKIRFYDGNYGINFMCIDKNIYKMIWGSCDLDGSVENEEFSAIIDINDFINELVDVNKQTIQFVKENNIKSDDFKAVEKYGSELIRRFPPPTLVLG